MPSANVFPNTVNIASKVSTNVNGGVTVTYVMADKDVAAMVVDPNAHLQLLYAQRQVFISKVVYITTDLTINTGDIVQFEGKNMFIQGRIDPSGEKRIFE